MGPARGPLDVYNADQLSAFATGDLPRSSLQPPLAEVDFNLQLFNSATRAAAKIQASGAASSEADGVVMLLAALGFKLPPFKSPREYMKTLGKKMQRVAKVYAKKHLKHLLTECQLDKLGYDATAKACEVDAEAGWLSEPNCSPRTTQTLRMEAARNKEDRVVQQTIGEGSTTREGCCTGKVGTALWHIT